MSPLADLIINVVFFALLFGVHHGVNERLTALETGDRPRSTSLNAQSMESIADTTAVIAGLKNGLVAEGMSPAVAEKIVLEVLRGAANSPKK